MIGYELHQLATSYQQPRCQVPLVAPHPYVPMLLLLQATSPIAMIVRTIAHCTLSLVCVSLRMFMHIGCGRACVSQGQCGAGLIKTFCLAFGAARWPLDHLFASLGLAGLRTSGSGEAGEKQQGKAPGKRYTRGQPHNLDWQLVTILPAPLHPPLGTARHPQAGRRPRPRRLGQT